MRMLLGTIAVAWLCCAGCAVDSVEPSPRDVREANDETLEPGHLPDIKQVLLEDDGTVTLVRDDPDETAMMLTNQAGDVVEAVNLQLGQQCVLSDGRHVTITYKLIGVNSYELTFEVTGRFDARAFGGDVRTRRKTVTILPYKDDAPLYP